MRMWTAAEVAELLEQPARRDDTVATDPPPPAGAVGRRVGLARWRRFAACRNRLELFYAGDEFSQRLACAICAGCGVRERCLADALEVEAGTPYRYGVRGGMTPAQRTGATSDRAHKTLTNHP